MKEKIQNTIFNILPRRSFVPVLSIVLLQFVAYYVPKILNRGRVFNDLTTFVDGVIPFVPVFVVFYVLAFLQWVVYYLLLAREEESVMRRYLLAGAIAKLCCMALFLIIPTCMTRPEIRGRGVFKFCCRVVYAFDEPSSLFPSMHCLESWFCMRLALEQHKRGRVPELARSIVKGYTGEMILCVNRKQFKGLEEYLTKIKRAELETMIERMVSRRKWRFEDQLAAAAEDAADAAEDEGLVYVRFHTIRTVTLSILVFLSTLFIKQHFFVDVIAGIVLAELSLSIGKLMIKEKTREPGSSVSGK